MERYVAYLIIGTIVTAMVIEEAFFIRRFQKRQRYRPELEKFGATEKTLRKTVANMRKPPED